MLKTSLVLLSLVSWLGSALYCYVIIRRVFKVPVADEDMLLARYKRRGRPKMDMPKLERQIPQLENTVPGLRYTALVPLSLAGMFALNGISRLVWFKDGTAAVWFSIALIFLPIAATVYLLAWEQGLLLARLKEVATGPTGMRVADMRAKLAEEKVAAAEPALKDGDG